MFVVFVLLVHKIFHGGVARYVSVILHLIRRNWGTNCMRGCPSYIRRRKTEEKHCRQPLIVLPHLLHLTVFVKQIGSAVVKTERVNDTR